MRTVMKVIRWLLFMACFAGVIKGIQSGRILTAVVFIILGAILAGAGKEG